MKRLPGPDHPLCIRRNRRFCRIAATRPGHKARHVRFLRRMRDIDSWLALGGANPSLPLFSRTGPGPIDPLKHIVPFHMFPLSDRIEATRRRAKGEIL